MERQWNSNIDKDHCGPLTLPFPNLLEGEISSAFRNLNSKMRSEQRNKTWLIRLLVKQAGLYNVPTKHKAESENTSCFEQKFSRSSHLVKNPNEKVFLHFPQKLQCFSAVLSPLLNLSRKKKLMSSSLNFLNLPLRSVCPLCS